MPSPVGHTLFGLWIYVIWCKNLPRLLSGRLSDWILIIWIIFCSNLPDFDLFIGLAEGDLSKYHQTYTHTLGFALIIGLATFLFLKIKKQNRIYSISFLTFISVYFHVILDSLNCDSRPPVGVMLFWPFSNRYFNPIQIFYPVPHSQPSDVFTSFFVNAVLREIMLLSVPLLILIYIKFKKSYGKG